MNTNCGSQHVYIPFNNTYAIKIEKLNTYIPLQIVKQYNIHNATWALCAHCGAKINGIKYMKRSSLFKVQRKKRPASCKNKWIIYNNPVLHIEHNNHIYSLLENVIDYISSANIYTAHTPHYNIIKVKFGKYHIQETNSIRKKNNIKIIPHWATLVKNSLKYYKTIYKNHIIVSDKNIIFAYKKREKLNISTPSHSNTIKKRKKIKKYIAHHNTQSPFLSLLSNSISNIYKKK